MALADDIRALRNHILHELTVTHDYYEDTKIAWGIVQRFIEDGQTVTSQNIVTGTVTTQIELAAKARGYVAEQLAEATFQQFISIFENFFFDLLRSWLLAYPQSLNSKQVDLKTVLEAEDKNAIILQVINKKLNEIMYDRPKEWFAYLSSLVKLHCPTPEEIDRIGEAKASRDILTHNRGIANKIYESKAGKYARYKDGQKIEVSEQYHRDTWNLIRKMVEDISDTAMKRTETE